MPDKLFKAVYIKMSLGYPADDLNVSQTTGAFLDIRFKIIGGFIKFQVTTLFFRNFSLGKFSGGPDIVRTELRSQLFK